jgi:hypothetical protein
MTHSLPDAAASIHLADRLHAGGRRPRDERGMTTAEYAVGTVSACGFAGVLYELLSSDFAQQLLQSLISKITDILPF